MAPPGAPASAGSETNGPNQAMNSVQPQSKPSPQASNVNSKLPQKREPQLPASLVPYPQIPNAASGFTNGAPIPGSISGIPGQVSGGTPASGAIGNVVGSGQYLPNSEGIVGGVTGGLPVVGGVVGGGVNQLPNGQGVAGQMLGNTPFRGVAGNLSPGSMQGSVEGANRQPGMGAQGGAAPFSLQGQAGQPDAADEGAGNGSASPSSITATPSSSPACTGQTNQASQSTTDSSSASATPVMDIEFAPSVPAPVPNTPTSGHPVPDGASVPSPPVQPPSSLPVSRPASTPTSPPVSAPAPPVAPRSIAQVFRDAGEPDHVPPSAPVKPPFSAPSSAPVSAPVHPSASASAPVPAPTQNAPKPPMFMRAKRALMGREPQMPALLSNDPTLPSGFPAPSLPIPSDIPPLLQSGVPTAVPATKDAMDAHSSLSHPVSNTGTFTSCTSSDYSPASTASTKDKMTPSKSTWRRRRFFRFNRD
ncbi:uncharacterized protein FOMMEDRAFT_23503 [Fomitiporia mediterranea MF3/22]|uniref:uncharacterized protein n=1 Tax=Fomitiporia mediterranea (strain MF3/22) TaxID=694068 RepID=UPI00044076F3|nr:uncharacterized protein FOMMEDRAFT_23503 [Fomitiporia mediterranea MF3/22]EJC98685.1 hypothetical protein FOMMEDRAFT_23503 [Fomitiporia mediterranea MF3/22]